MKKQKTKKRSVTLIEIMIVILLIGLIGGALAFNMRGSMDKGRVFKSEQNATRVYDALMMEYAKGEKSLDAIASDKLNIVKRSPLIKDAASILKDGWGEELKVEVDQEQDDLTVYSEKARKWQESH